LTNLEAVAITALLPTWKSDVPSVFHAWRIVQSSTESKNPLN
jgi:hypothetical protein